MRVAEYKTKHSRREKTVTADDEIADWIGLHQGAAVGQVAVKPVTLPRVTFLEKCTKPNCTCGF